MDGAALGRVVVKRYIESYKHAEDHVAGHDVRDPQRRDRAVRRPLDAFTMALRRAIKDDDVDATPAAAGAHPQRPASTAT